MPVNHQFPPEGLRPPASHTLSTLRLAAESGTVLEGHVGRCGADHTLYFSLNGIRGIMPKEEVVAPWISGADREISVLSRVGKETCFTVQSITCDEKGSPVARLSRRAAQEQAMEFFLEQLIPGSILTGRVTRLETFGAFVDIGCGIIAMLPIEHTSVSRIGHPKDRFHTGQKILAAVLSIDRELRRITLTHKELLGTWLENASHFREGETVPGIVRSIKEYGCFVELTPNLSGLADLREGLQPGEGVSVYIKSITPERMKIKLHIIDRLPEYRSLSPISYQITDGVLDRWVYSPPGCLRPAMETDFTADGP